jgi:Flp pilus assembly protein CpaB
VGRKRPRAATALLGVSVVLAVGVTVALRGYLAAVEAQAASPRDAVPVVVAAVPLSRGTVLGTSLLRPTSRPVKR